MLDDLRAIFARDLATLGREIAAYPSDDALWQQLAGTTNSGGTLALHLVGNLQHFVGAVLGGSGFVRDRDAEFARRDLTRAQLADEITRTAAAVERALTTLAPAKLAEPFPVALAGRTLSTNRALLHLSAHLAYHLGQMDYHRRAISQLAGESKTVGAMGLETL